jgi:hypothetical protein
MFCDSSFGASGEIRTHDLLITNQLHYPCATLATPPIIHRRSVNYTTNAGGCQEV